MDFLEKLANEVMADYSKYDYYHINGLCVAVALVIEAGSEDIKDGDKLKTGSLELIVQRCSDEGFLKIIAAVDLNFTGDDNAESLKQSLVQDVEQCIKTAQENASEKVIEYIKQNGFWCNVPFNAFIALLDYIENINTKGQATTS